MEAGKILYATDASQPGSAQLQGLMGLRNLGVKEVVFLKTTKGESWESSLAGFGMNHRVVVADGPLVPCILSTARKEAVSMIAASLNRDETGLLRKPVTRVLLRSSPVPVMILPEDAQATRSGQDNVFAHVIFATDWSSASQKALGYLLGFDEIIHELEIVHVVDKNLSIRDMQQLKYQLAQSRKVFMDEGIDAEAHVYAGKPPEEIMLAARDYDGTCIVMGTTGKSSVKNLLSPSYSYRVAEASVVPALVVP